MILGLFAVAIYVVPALLLAAARRPVLIRGERFAAAVLIFLGADAARIALGPAQWAVGAVVFWVAHAMLLPVAGKRWLIWRLDPEAARELLESRMRMLRLPFERAPGGFSLPAPAHSCLLQLSPLGRRSTILVIGNGYRRKKVRLLRALVAKALRPVYPRPVIALGTRNHVAG